MKNYGITKDVILETADVLSKYIFRTPLIRSDYYSEINGSDVFFKLENIQVTGSFKARGAMNMVLNTDSEKLNKGIFTVSAGNHALGVANALRHLGHKGSIILPENASPAKVEALKYFPVDLEFHGKSYDEAEDYAVSLISKTDKTFIHPYNNPIVIAGQASIGVEIFEDNKNIDILLVPVGGGGLIAGIALAAKYLLPNIKIFGVQSEASPVFKRSIDSGELVRFQLDDSVADGLHGLVDMDSITFPIVMDTATDILLVSEDEIRTCITEFIQTHHMILEGSAAVIPAAVKSYSSLFEGKRVAGVLSGSNIDTRLLNSILSETLK
ncbi:threonine/serine dehydratase [candidate division KSB1 bacterium]